MRLVLRSIVGSSHTGPTLAVAIATVVIGIGVGLEPYRLVLLGLALLANQTSVALSNDWLDAKRDLAAGRDDKPLAIGLISEYTVRTAAFVTAGLAIALTLPLGPPAAIAHAIALAAGWAYNAWLKLTPFSILTYAVGFGMLPVIATLARQEPVLPAPWAIVAGALLGIAAQFANALPDLADDVATGVRGLPHLLGRKASGIITAFTLAGSSCLIAFGPGTTLDPLRVAALLATILLAVFAAILAIARPPKRLLFQLIVLAALINVVMLAAAGHHLYS